MSTSDVTLTCDCGNHLHARFQDAGGQISCECGINVPVPSLGKLRTLAGEDAYTTNAVEAIRKRENAGRAPAGNNCLVCNAPNCTIRGYLAICESEYTVGRDASYSNDLLNLTGKLFFLLAAPLLLFPSLFRGKAQNEVRHFGRDTSVEINLPVCDACSSHCNHTSGARELMKHVELYNQLLEEFPKLRLQK